MSGRGECHPPANNSHSTTSMILLFRNGSVVTVPGALCAFLLCSLLLSASVMVRLSAAALYIGFGRCLCLHNQHYHVTTFILLSYQVKTYHNTLKSSTTIFISELSTVHVYMKTDGKAETFILNTFLTKM